MSHQMPLLHSGTEKTQLCFIWCVIKCHFDATSDAELFCKIYGCGRGWAIPEKNQPEVFLTEGFCGPPPPLKMDVRSLCRKRGGQKGNQKWEEGRQKVTGNAEKGYQKVTKKESGWPTPGKFKVPTFLRVWSFHTHALFILSADDLGNFPGILWRDRPESLADNLYRACE